MFAWIGGALIGAVGTALVVALSALVRDRLARYGDELRNRYREYRG